MLWVATIKPTENGAESNALFAFGQDGPRPGIRVGAGERATDEGGGEREGEGERKRVRESSRRSTVYCWQMQFAIASSVRT